MQRRSIFRLGVVHKTYGTASTFKCVCVILRLFISKSPCHSRLSIPFFQNSFFRLLFESSCLLCTLITTIQEWQPNFSCKAALARNFKNECLTHAKDTRSCEKCASNTHQITWDTHKKCLKGNLQVSESLDGQNTLNTYMRLHQKLET